MTQRALHRDVHDVRILRAQRCAALSPKLNPRAARMLGDAFGHGHGRVGRERDTGARIE
jgi:hypothetical protein